jgi:hypothetical protein
MFRKLLIADVLLAALLGWGVLRVRQDAIAFEASHRVENIQAAPENVAPLPAAPSAPVATNVAEWTDILARNPFSFDRNDVPIVVGTPQTAVPLNLGPKPTLFGTMALGRDRVAMIAPGGNPGQAAGRNSRPMRVGESMNGWELVEIHDKSVVMRAGDRMETLVMNDPTAQVPRDAARTITPTPAPTVQVVQGSASSQTNIPQAAAAPSSPDDLSARPAPLDENGRPKKGRWIPTPFGPHFCEQCV